jgi:hypothetical protein
MILTTLGLWGWASTLGDFRALSVRPTDLPVLRGLFARGGSLDFFDRFRVESALLDADRDDMRRMT